MRRCVSWLLPFLFITACGPQVKFVKPQPANGKNLIYIPSEFRGKYMNLSDSSLLEIDSVSVVSRWFYEKFIPKDSIVEIEKDLNLAIKRDTQILITEKRDNWLSNGVTLTVKFIGSQVKITADTENKLFEVSDSQLIRKYKGYCFLNTQTPEGLWLVKILGQKDNKLIFDDLLDAELAKKLKHINKVSGPIDSTKNSPSEYYLNPTRRELRKILKNRDFEGKYIRMSNKATIHQ